MKTWFKKEMKKHPYKKTRPLFKTSIISQIEAREQRIKDKLPNYAIVDDKGKIIEKFRGKATALQMMPKIQKEYFVRLKIVPLNNDGSVTT